MMFLLLSALFLSFSHSLPIRDEPTLDQLRAGQPLLVGVIGDFRPFNFESKISTGERSGMDHDIVISVASRLNISNVSFVSFPLFTDLYSALQNGEIDVIANNLWKTPFTEPLFSLSIPYYVKGGISSMWLKGRGPFNTTESLSGARVAIFKKGPYIEAFARNSSPATLILESNSSILFHLLLSGEIDAALGYFTQQRLDLTDRGDDIEHALIHPEKAVLGLRKSTNLLVEVNDALDNMWEDGSLFRIKSKYLLPLGIEPATTRPRASEMNRI